MLPRTPDNWNDSADWDKHWMEILKNDERTINRSLYQDIFYLTFEDSLKQRGVKTVLFLGNGISQAPKFFAYRDFEVVALDISRVATEYARNFEFEYQEFYQQFNDKYFSVNKKVWLSYCEAGHSVSFICASFLDPDVAPGPFDLIISSRTLQGFAKNEKLLKQAIYSIHNRLSPTGCFFNSTLNNSLARDMIDQELENLGYSVSKSDPRDNLAELDKRVGWNLFATA